MVVESPIPIITSLLTVSTLLTTDMPPGDNVEDIPLTRPLPTPHGSVLPPPAKPLFADGITNDLHAKFIVTPALPLSRSILLSRQSRPPPVTARNTPSVASTILLTHPRPITPPPAPASAAITHQKKSSQIITIAMPPGLWSSTRRPLHSGATVVSEIRPAQIPATNRTFFLSSSTRLTPAISPNEIKDHYTRMQILSLTNVSSMPTTDRILADYNITLKNTSPYKMLSMASFIALVLVKASVGDVVAVSLDLKRNGKLSIEFTRNYPTTEDLDKANQLVELCREHIIKPRTSLAWIEFRSSFLKTMLTWGQSKVKSRLIAITGGNDSLRGARVAAKAKSILSMQKVRELHKGLPNSHELYNVVRDRYERRCANSNDVVQARGDKTLIAQCDNQKLTLYEVVDQFIQVIESGVHRFHRGFREGRHDTNQLFSTFLACDILGSSDLFHDILDLHGIAGSSRDHFTRSLRKVGQYANGLQNLYNGVKNCANGFVVREIDINMICPPDKVLAEAYVIDATPGTRNEEMIGVKQSMESEEGGDGDKVHKKFLVDCHTDWYTFIQERAEVLLGERLGISESHFTASGLGRYKSSLPLPIHAELTLALSRRSRGIKSGELGVSKDCCASCNEGLRVLRKSGYSYDVRGCHGKIYSARLTGENIVDHAIMTLVKENFDTWLHIKHNKPDSDVPMSPGLKAANPAQEAEHDADLNELRSFFSVRKEVEND